MLRREQLHGYQRYASEFICSHPESAILLDCGCGKTIITLTAIADLLWDRFEIRKVLVICPIRVAQVWAEEIGKWEHLSGLRFSIAVGTESQRRYALECDADVYVINRDVVPWLVENYAQKWCWDMLVIDELSSFKNPQAKRFKSLLKVRPKVRRIVGLTGTPSSNGLMDLWAEYRLLDLGERLGKFIGSYRSSYFRPDKTNGVIVYSYKPALGGRGDDAGFDRLHQIAGRLLDLLLTAFQGVERFVVSVFLLVLNDLVGDGFDKAVCGDDLHHLLENKRLDRVLGDAFLVALMPAALVADVVIVHLS